MLRRTCLPILLLAAVWAIGADRSVCAQDRERAEGLFKFSDKNNNGEIDPEEFQGLSTTTRERLQKAGITGAGSIKKDAFIAATISAEDSRRKEQGGNSGGRGSKAKDRVTLALPPQYTALDKNRDGQISIAEWDRTKLSEFRQLDRNGDGFLTPRELTNAPAALAMTALAKTATPGVTSPSSGRSQFNSGSNPPGTSSSGAAPADAAADDPLQRQAKFYFSSVDKDKDGQITAEEWAASRGARPLFEAAKVTPSFPLSQDTFIEQFKQIKK